MLPLRRKLPLGLAYSAIGDFGRAAELLRRTVEAADRESGTPSTGLRIQSRAFLALPLSALGAFAEGRHHGEEALHLATLEGRGSAPITAHGCLGLLYLTKGDLEHAIRVLAQGLALCRLAGRGDEAWQYARQALDLARQRKARGHEALALQQLGAVHAHTDPPGAA